MSDIDAQFNIEKTVSLLRTVADRLKANRASDDPLLTVSLLAEAVCLVLTTGRFKGEPSATCGAPIAVAFLERLSTVIKPVAFPKGFPQTKAAPAESSPKAPRFSEISPEALLDIAASAEKEGRKIYTPAGVRRAPVEFSALAAALRQ